MVLWLFRFLFLIAIFLGMVIVVVSFYSARIDVREVEAVLLSQSFLSCLEEQHFSTTFFTSFDAVAKRCNIVLEEGESYVNLTFYKNDEAKTTIGLTGGNENLAELCKLKTGKNLPKCLENRYYILIKDEKGKSSLVLLSINIAIAKVLKNT